MTPASLKSKLTLQLPLALSTLVGLFLVALHYSASDTIAAPDPPQLLTWCLFTLLLFFITRLLLTRMTVPLFDFFGHLEAQQLQSIDGQPCTSQSPSLDVFLAQFDMQRKTAQRHEQIYRTLGECSSELLYWISPDMHTLNYISPRCQALTGYSAEEFYADASLLERIIQSDLRDHWREQLGGTGNLVPAELAIQNCRGGTVWVKHTCRPVFSVAGECTGVHGSFIDITHLRESDQARLASEKTLQLQNDYLRALHETTLGLIGRLELRGQLSTIITRAATLMDTEHGFVYLLNEEKQELELQVKLGVFEAFALSHMKRGEGFAGYVWDQGTPCATGNYQDWVTGTDISRCKGIKATAGVPLTSGNQVIGVIGLSYTSENELFDDEKLQQLQQFGELASLALDNARLYDSARKELEERAKAEERLRKLSHAVMQCPVAIMITDLRGTIEFANPQVSRLTGYDSQELLGQNTRILKSGFTSLEKYQNLWETILSGRQWRGELQNRNKGGQLYWERVLISPIRDAEGAITHFIAIQEDISDLKILENQLRHSQKMEAIGQLAGGVAHDFNNILTAILGYGNILLLKLPSESPFRKTAEQILAAAERGASLTQGLLTFSRKQASNLTRMDLNQIIERVEKLLVTLIGDSSTLISELSPLPLPILADGMQIEQVLINLATNVRDSMPEGGTVTISTGVVELDAAFQSSYGFGNGRFVLLTLTDTGYGMDEETVRRIFEPFYTTKETGKGVGLGLSIVYGIIKKHNGHIICNSKPGEGTEFRLYLPLAEENQLQPPLTLPTPSAAPTPTAKKDLILLIDYDETERKLTSSLLEEFGYGIIQAHDEATAVQQCCNHQTSLCAVILNGTALSENDHILYQKLRKNIPAEKILFCYDTKTTILETLLTHDKKLHTIPKPFAPKELLMKVREVVQDAL